MGIGGIGDIEREVLESEIRDLDKEQEEFMMIGDWDKFAEWEDEKNKIREYLGIE